MKNKIEEEDNNIILNEKYKNDFFFKYMLNCWVNQKLVNRFPTITRRANFSDVPKNCFIRRKVDPIYGTKQSDSSRKTNYLMKTRKRTLLTFSRRFAWPRVRVFVLPRFLRNHYVFFFHWSPIACKSWTFRVYVTNAVPFV